MTGKENCSGGCEQEKIQIYHKKRIIGTSTLLICEYGSGSEKSTDDIAFASFTNT